jgi:MinD-like ATPase involved in chromosome partitioning or flagellar assembly
MRTVVFYSYKGGVGRSLLLANAARFLALAGKRVVALDLDLEAPGLHYKLGSLEVLACARDGGLHGAVDELLAVLADAGGRPIADFAVAIDLPSDCRGSLHLIPAGSAPSTQYWTALAKLAGVTRIESAIGGIADAVLDLQARIADELAPDFLLVDARTGITEMGGLATTVVADRVVCLTSASPESIEGTLVVARALRTAPRLPGQAAIEIEFLLTRVDVPGPPGAALVPAETETELLHSRIDREDDRGQSEPKLTFSAILPHDRTIANEERVLGGERTHDRRATLFEATLAWIEKSFPSLAADAEMARKRMAAVDRAWHELTDRRKSINRGSESYQHWSTHRLRGGVRFRARSDAGPERFADIVAYDRPASEPDARPVLVIEYVANEDRDRVAQWWLQAGDFAIVCLLGERSAAEARLFARSFDYKGVRHSERLDLPMPYEFEALHEAMSRGLLNLGGGSADQ